MPTVSHEVARPDSHPNSRQAIANGATSGCPFCFARQLQVYQAGEHVTILNGNRAGMSGLIVDVKHTGGPDQFGIRGDSQRRSGYRLFSKFNTLISTEPIIRPAAWMLPLSIQDHAVVDEVIVRSCEDLASARRKWRPNTLHPCIEIVWRLRLPIRGAEMLAAYIAHGASPRWSSRFIELFDSGLDLLVFSHGRAPIARRRIPSLSSGRYEPHRRDPIKRALFKRLLDWD